MPRSDEELMLAIAGGERPAFAEILRRFAPVLVQRLLNEIGDAALAMGLAQETFVQLHRARFDFRPGMSVDSWLDTIAMNLARARARCALATPRRR